MINLIFLISPQADLTIGEIAIYICVGIVFLILICIGLIFLISYLKKKNKNLKKIDKNELFLSLGGEGNILNFEQKGSRLSIFFKNKDLIDVNKLKDLGFNNYILLSNKITFTLDENLKKYIKDFLN